MLYNYIKEQYKEAEPIFLSDLLRTNITESVLNQQLKELCENGLLQQYDGEVLIGNRRFVVRKPVVPIAKENVHVLQMLELFIKEYPQSALEYYYELGLEHVLA